MALHATSWAFMTPHAPLRNFIGFPGTSMTLCGKICGFISIHDTDCHYSFMAAFMKFLAQNCRGHCHGATMELS